MFTEKKKWFSGKMNLKLKKGITKRLVWSVTLYAAETWNADSDRGRSL